MIKGGTRGSEHNLRQISAPTEASFTARSTKPRWLTCLRAQSANETAHVTLVAKLTKLTMCNKANYEALLYVTVIYNFFHYMYHYYTKSVYSCS